MRVNFHMDGVTTEQLRTLAAAASSISWERGKPAPVVRCEGPEKWTVWLTEPVPLHQAEHLLHALMEQEYVGEAPHGS